MVNESEEKHEMVDCTVFLKSQLWEKLCMVIMSQNVIIALVKLLPSAVYQAVITFPHAIITYFTPLTHK